MRRGCIALGALLAFAVSASNALAVAPQITNVRVTEASTSSVTLSAEIDPEEAKTTYRFEYGPKDCEASACTKVPIPEGSAGEGASPVEVSETVAGLPAGTAFHFRLVAKNGVGAANTTKSPDRLFATYSPAISGLPDGRVYEQASPVKKDGGDVIGTQSLVKSSPTGDAISFASTSGVPGGVGAQELPLFLARRSGGEWSTRGLLPPAQAGQVARVLGWLPSFAQVFTTAGKVGAETSSTIFSQAGSGGPLTQLVPYVPEARYALAGASADGSRVAFESTASLGTPAGAGGAFNVYAWERASGAVSLASVFNDGTPVPGAFAGPYNWASGATAVSLREGGATSDYYLQGTHAVSSDGSVYLTEAGTGQLYLRLHPTQPQGVLDAEGRCAADEACTVHVSASEKDNGEGPDHTDAAGTEPAAFMAATQDGSAAFFTSHEKLTDDATTGPEPKPAAIGKAKLNGSGAATVEDPEFLLAKGVGVVTDGEHVYWADPARGTIGRADLDGDPDSIEPEFIVPGPTEFETHPETEPGVIHSVPSIPRYVAIADGYIFWTNAGPRGGDFLGEPQNNILNGAGTIGIAKLNGPGPASGADPAFITGATNPQGIAANSEHIYWANAGEGSATRRISRAEVSGGVLGVVEIEFGPEEGAQVPQGVALDGSDVYWSANEGSNSFLRREPLAGGAVELTFFESLGDNLRGIALDGSFIYWAAQKGGTAGAIGRLPLADLGTGKCVSLPSCEREFISPLTGALNGLAIEGEELYFTTNGETPRNPGNDLYRYSLSPGAGGKHLTDLTVNGAANGAEVQGLLGATADGKVLYFAANGVLTSIPNESGEVASQGSCQVSQGGLAGGSCNLYRWEEDPQTQARSTAFVARLDANGNEDVGDWANWEPQSTLSARKTAFLSPDGRTLLFRSRRQLSAYPNEGIPELYRYRVGEPIACVSCAPSGAAPEGLTRGPKLGSIYPSALPPPTTAALASRNLSANGNRVFFESTEALAIDDTNGDADTNGDPCPLTGTNLQQFPACRDVYEWEAVGEGNCAKGSSNYAPLNSGCLYLISSGKDDYPSFFADASSTGEDAFIFTRQSLVVQDKDELLDVYDARVGGGIASQNPPPPPIPCESAGTCHGPAQPPAGHEAVGSANFHGAGDQNPKRKKAKKHHKRHRKHRHKKTGKGQKRHHARAERGGAR